MTIKPEEQEMARFVRRRFLRAMLAVKSKWSGDAESIPPLLPFDHTSSDAEIRAVLRKHEIRWVNRISGRPDVACVSRIDRIVRRGGHDDYIEFLDKQAGFRAVYLNQIVSVD